MARRGKREDRVGKREERLRGLLFEMEPQLRRQAGLVELLRALSVSSSAIEPEAMMVLAEIGEETRNAFRLAWSEALEELRTRQNSI